MKYYLKQFINENYAHHQLLLRENEQHDFKKLIADESNQYVTEGDDDTSNIDDLNSYEQNLIDRLLDAFFYSRKSNPLDLVIDKTTLITKELMANFIVQPIKRVITFANLIPDFQMLNQNDQSLLIQSNCIDIFICSSSLLFDMNNNKIINKDVETSESLKVDQFFQMWGKELFEKTISYLKSMNELNIDLITLILYLCVILFTPKKVDFNDKEKIEHLKRKFSSLLKKHVHRSSNQNRLLDDLLVKLDELSELSTLHRSFFSDLEINSNVEKIAKSILMNN